MSKTKNMPMPVVYYLLSLWNHYEIYLSTVIVKLSDGHLFFLWSDVIICPFTLTQLLTCILSSILGDLAFDCRCLWSGPSWSSFCFVCVCVCACVRACVCVLSPMLCIATSMTRTSLGTRKSVLDVGSSSHWGLIIARGEEKNRDNLGMSFRSSIK